MRMLPLALLIAAGLSGCMQTVEPAAEAPAWPLPASGAATYTVSNNSATILEATYQLSDMLVVDLLPDEGEPAQVRMDLASGTSEVDQFNRTHMPPAPYAWVFGPDGRLGARDAFGLLPLGALVRALSGDTRDEVNESVRVDDGQWHYEARRACVRACAATYGQGVIPFVDLRIEAWGDVGGLLPTQVRHTYIQQNGSAPHIMDLQTTQIEHASATVDIDAVGWPARPQPLPDRRLCGMAPCEHGDLAPFSLQDGLESLFASQAWQESGLEKDDVVPVQLIAHRDTSHLIVADQRLEQGRDYEGWFATFLTKKDERRTFYGGGTTYVADVEVPGKTEWRATQPLPMYDDWFDEVRWPPMESLDASLERIMEHACIGEAFSLRLVVLEAVVSPDPVYRTQLVLSSKDTAVSVSPVYGTVLTTPQGDACRDT